MATKIENLEERKAWFGCFTAALAGLVAARGGSSGLPEGPLRKAIVEEAGGVADEALGEIRKRQPDVTAWAEWV